MKKFALLCLALAGLAACVQDPEIESNVPVFSDESLSATPQTHSVTLSAVYSGSDASSITGCGFKLGKDVSLSDGKEYPSAEVANHTLQLEISGLDADQTYYYQAFARNGSGLVCSAVRSFKTLAEALPPAPGEKPSFLYLVNSRNEVGDVALKAKFSPAEGYDLLKVGLCYAKTAQPTSADNSVTATLDGDQVMTVQLTDLEPETVYFFRAFAEVYSETAGKETVYSDAETLTTKAAPTVNPTDWINFVDPYARLACVARFDLNGDGGVSYQEAAQAESLDNLFSDYTSVASFDEIQYFTGATSIVQAFKNCTHLSSITIPDNFTNLGSGFYGGIFSGCTSLESVKLPANVTKLGYSAFFNCTSLQSIDLPASLTTIENYAFSGCSALKQVNSMDQLMSIGSQAFMNCVMLSSVSFAEGVAIGSEAFANCSGLKTIHLKSAQVEKKAFANCANVETILLDGVVTGVYSGDTDGPFNGTGGAVEARASVASRLFCNSNISSVVFGPACESIGSYAFYKANLLSGTLDLTPVHSIEDYAFYQSPVSGVVFSDQLTAIGEYAFSGSSLTSVQLPGSLGKGIEWYAFYACPALKTIVAEEGITELTVHVFRECPQVETISLPKTLQRVDGSTFRGTGGVLTLRSDLSSGNFSSADFRSVIVEEGVTTLPQYAFSDCSELTSVTLPSSLTTISAWAFQNTVKMHSFVIPETVTHIGGASFVACGKDDPESHLEIRCNIPAVYSTSYIIFKDAFHEIDVAEGVTSLGWIALSNTGARVIRLPSTLTTIGDNALSGNIHLQSVILPSGMTTIPEYFLSGCSALTQVNLPSTLTTISRYAFQSCSSLSQIAFPSGLSYIGDYAFSATGLQEVSLPASVSVLSSQALPTVSVVHMKGTTPPNHNGPFDKAVLQHIYVPTSAVATYKSSWSIYKDYISGE